MARYRSDNDLQAVTPHLGEHIGPELQATGMLFLADEAQAADEVTSLHICTHLCCLMVLQ